MGSGERLLHLRSGLKLKSDTRCAPTIVIQPFHQHQVQQVQPKPSLCPAFPVSISEALNQLSENAWHKDEDGCRPFEHNTGYIRSTLALQSTLQRFRAREWRDAGQELMHSAERAQLRCQSYHRPSLAQIRGASLTAWALLQVHY